MNAIKQFRDLPFIEYTPRGCAPLVSITAPNIRDDGYISHREWEPLKSLKLNTPVSDRQRNPDALA